jgi:hypothetical protein
MVLFNKLLFGLRLYAFNFMISRIMNHIVELDVKIVTRGQQSANVQGGHLKPSENNYYVRSLDYPEFQSIK